MITNETITINNITLPAAELNRLIAEGKQVEAIAYITQHAGLGLKDAKHFVDTLTRVDDMLNQGKDNVKQQVTVTRTNKGFTVKYTGPTGTESIITPSDTAWAEVKKMMPDNDLIREYEESWQHNGNETQIDHVLSSSDTAPQNNNLKKYMVIAFLALLVAAYFLLK